MILKTEDVIQSLVDKYPEKDPDIIKELVDIYWESLLKQIQTPSKPEIASLWGTFVLSENLVQREINKVNKKLKSNPLPKLEEKKTNLESLLEFAKTRPRIKSEKRKQTVIRKTEYYDKHNTDSRKDEILKFLLKEDYEDYIKEFYTKEH